MNAGADIEILVYARAYSGMTAMERDWHIVFCIAMLAMVVVIFVRVGRGIAVGRDKHTFSMVFKVILVSVQASRGILLTGTAR